MWRKAETWTNVLGLPVSHHTLSPQLAAAGALAAIFGHGSWVGGAVSTCYFGKGPTWCFCLFPTQPLWRCLPAGLSTSSMRRSLWAAGSSALANGRCGDTQQTGAFTTETSQQWIPDRSSSSTVNVQTSHPSNLYPTLSGLSSHLQCQGIKSTCGICRTETFYVLRGRCFSACWWIQGQLFLNAFISHMTNSCFA